MGVGIANLRVAGIHLKRVSRFWVDETSDADVREKTLARILDRDCDDIVTLCQQLEGVVNVRFEEIGNDEYDCVLVQHPRNVVDCGHHVGASTNSLESQNIPADVQIM